VSWVSVSASIAYVISSKGYKKKSLSKDGAIAAFIVGLISFLSSAQIGFVLIAFFLSSSILTRFGSEKKAKIEDGFKEGGERTTIQVVSNSLPAVACACLWLFYFGFTFTTQHTVLNIATLEQLRSSVSSVGTRLPELLFAGIVAHYACCCGDTWASELGSLAVNPPRLITNPFKLVPTGTNGGVSSTGLTASIFGGTFIGFLAYLTTSIFALISFVNGNDRFVLSGREATTAMLLVSNFHYVILGAFAGLFGSLLDSLLGATLQISILDKDTGRVLSHAENEVIAKALKDKSRYIHITGRNILDNHQVNLLSSTMICVLAMLVHSLVRI